MQAEASRVEVPDQRTLEKSLPRDHYVSEEHFTVEKERIFAHEWFCVAREEEVPNPRDYLVLDVAGESILITRTKTGELRAFYNVCRHRGSQLKWDKPARCGGEGSVSVRPSGSTEGNWIRCPYHAWTYGLEGDLRGAPFLPGALNKADFSLYAVGAETWGGFVFLNLTPKQAPALHDQLGPIPERVERYPLTELRSGARMVYKIRANWKVILENYNECYHCGTVHPELCELVPAFAEGGGANLDWDEGVPHREGAFTFTFTGTSDRAPFPGLTEEERTRHKGELSYPNLMLSLSADHVAAFTLWPDGANDTTIVCDWLFHPSEIEKSSFDPSDAVEFWDMVNRQDWRICESVQRGMESRAFETGYLAPMEDVNRDIRRYLDEKLGKR
ncbi:MAG: aromatic ring-hydroxylating dioxygenase subunit alpha [Actinomycetota bacterium]